MKIRMRIDCILPGLMCLPAIGHAGPECQVDRFLGATSPQGAIAHMRVINNGGKCSVRNLGVPSDRKNPADTGKILRLAAHGTAEFVAPRASYKPDSGYVGDDEFEYEAFARSRDNRPLRLRVLVKVSVLST